MGDAVICRSDTSYAERPLAFYWHGQQYEITQILAGWKTPNGKRFLVKTGDKLFFNLYYDEMEDLWQISQSELPKKPKGNSNDRSRCEKKFPC